MYYNYFWTEAEIFCKIVLLTLVTPRGVTDLHLSWRMHIEHARTAYHKNYGIAYQQPHRRCISQAPYYKWNIAQVRLMSVSDVSRSMQSWVSSTYRLYSQLSFLFYFWTINNRGFAAPGWRPLGFRKWDTAVLQRGTSKICRGWRNERKRLDEIQWTSNEFGHPTPNVKQQQEAAAAPAGSSSSSRKQHQQLQQQQRQQDRQQQQQQQRRRRQQYCVFIWTKGDFQIAQTTTQSSSCIFLHWQQNTWRQHFFFVNLAHQKQKTPPKTFEPPTHRLHEQRSIPATPLRCIRRPR